MARCLLCPLYLGALYGAHLCASQDTSLALKDRLRRSDVAGILFVVCCS